MATIYKFDGEKAGYHNLCLEVAPGSSSGDRSKGTLRVGVYDASTPPKLKTLQDSYDINKGVKISLFKDASLNTTFTIIEERPPLLGSVASIKVSENANMFLTGSTAGTDSPDTNASNWVIGADDVRSNYNGEPRDILFGSLDTGANGETIIWAKFTSVDQTSGKLEIYSKSWRQAISSHLNKPLDCLKIMVFACA